MTRTLIPLIYYAIIYARVCKGYECIEKLLFKYEIKLLYKTFLCDSSKRELFWQRCSPLMFLLSIYIRPLPGQKVLSFSWIFSTLLMILLLWKPNQILMYFSQKICGTYQPFVEYYLKGVQCLIGSCHLKHCLFQHE